MKLLKIIALTLFCCTFQMLRGQEVLGGYIELVKRGIYVVEAKVTFAIRSSQASVVKPHIMVSWGDGTPPDSIPLKYGPYSGIIITYISYVGTHTFSPGIYTITTSDNFFSPNIANIPNSAGQKLVLRRMINLQDYKTIGVVTPALPTFSQIFDTVHCQASQYEANLGFYSPYDSLSFSLEPHADIPGYVLPPVSVNSITGDFTFIANALGPFNICMRIDEWRRYPTINDNFRVGTSFINLCISACNITSGVDTETQNEIKGIKMFPNPVRDKLHITFSGFETNGLKLCILNSLGQVVRSIELVELRQEIDLSDLASGIYFLRSGQTVYKVVKE